MTTNANKYGLRAAAAERSNRHAQRTPLPPRPGDIADAQEAVAEAKEILSGNGKSERKAAAIAALAVGLGWTAVASASDADPDRWELVATRDSEVIHQAWVNGVWQYEASTYTIGDRGTRPRNAAGTKKLLERSAADAQSELQKVASNTFFKRRVTTDAPSVRRTKLPFEMTDDPDVIMSALQGKRVKWLNRQSGSPEEASITGTRHNRLAQVGEERIFQFCEHRGQGFRAFRLSDILRVR